MKKLILITCLFCLSHWSMAQSIGLRAGTEVSNSPIATGTFGFGTYINFNNFSDKFEAMIYGDYSSNKNRLQNTEAAISDYQRKAVGIAGLYRIPLAERIAFKLGPDMSYTWIDASLRGQEAQWHEEHNANYTGIGIITNLHIQRVLNLPINLDIFATPNYLMRTKNPPGSASKKSLKQLYLQIGASYVVGKK